jgi:hypothetical protein
VEVAVQGLFPLNQPINHEKNPIFILNDHLSCYTRGNRLSLTLK